MAKEYSRVPTSEADFQVPMSEKSKEALEAAPIYLAGHVYPTQKRCKGRRACLAMFMGFIMTMFTVGTIRLMSHGGCPFSGFKHHGRHGLAHPHEGEAAHTEGLQLQHTQGGHLVPTSPALGTKTEMDMIVLSDAEHPIPDIALQALASAKLRALRAAGYNVESVNMAVIPQDKDHHYTMKQAYELGMKAIHNAQAVSRGLEMKMRMMADRAKQVMSSLFDQLKEQKA